MTSSKPVGLSRDLPPKRVMRANVGGQDLVVWRAPNGDVAAWDNRCPHRGMALSHGFVRGDTLACLYHGWHYDSAGRCTYIPAHPELEPPETIQTEIFSVIEDQGVIWVNTQGEAEAVELPAAFKPLRTITVNANPEGVHRGFAQVAFEGQKPVETSAGVYTMGGLSLAVLDNPQGDARTQVTIMVSEAATPRQSLAFSRWCERIRRAAETSVRGTA